MKQATKATGEITESGSNISLSLSAVSAADKSDGNSGEHTPVKENRQESSDSAEEEVVPIKEVAITMSNLKRTKDKRGPAGLVNEANAPSWFKRKTLKAKNLEYSDNDGTM